MKHTTRWNLVMLASLAAMAVGMAGITTSLLCGACPRSAAATPTAELPHCNIDTLEQGALLRAGQTNAQASARLHIHTRPAARVFIDGVDTGMMTPLLLSDAPRLAPGVHNVVLETPDRERFAYDVLLTLGDNTLVVAPLGAEPGNAIGHRCEW